MAYLTPVKLEHLLPSLLTYSDQNFAAIIFRGLRFGFRIGFNHQEHRLRISRCTRPSAFANLSAIDERLADKRLAVELAAG